MEENLICPSCHLQVRNTDYFCFNCGKNLHPKPPSTSISSQTSLYIGSLLLPPMGIIWGLRYLRQPDRESKIVGVIAIILTIVILVLLTQFTVNLINTVNEQVNSQLQSLQGF